MLTLQQLRTPATADEGAELVVDTLADAGLDSKSWQVGSWQHTISRLVSDIYAPFTEQVKALAELLFNELSFGDGLTAFSKSHYDNTRTAATRARHTLRLTATSTAGPYTIAIGVLTAQEVVSGKGYLYTCVALPNGATLNPSGTLDVTVEAQLAGTGPNVAPASITKLITPLAGVTCSNPDLGGGTSLTTTGVDAQSDPSLQESNRTKWGSLTWATPADGYLFYAKQGAAAVARVKVDQGNPRGPGTVDVYVATATGVAGATDVSGAQAQITKKHSGTPNPLVIAAAAATQNFSGNIYVSSSFFTGGTIQTAKKTEIEKAITDYVNGLPIGGTILPPPDGNGVLGYLLASEWQGAVTDVEGVKNIGSPSPAANVLIPAYQVATVGTLTGLTYVAI